MGHKAYPVRCLLTTSYSRPFDWYGGTSVNPVRCLLDVYLIVGLLTGVEYKGYSCEASLDSVSYSQATEW